MERTDTAGAADAWQYITLVTAVIGTLIVMLLQDPIAQDIAYHSFADTRTFFGIANFFDVTTNIPFLVVGSAGVKYCLKNASTGFWPGWFALFAGVAMISFGSGYFHLNPSNDTLVWDRLPMTIGFMGLFVALLSEYLHLRVGQAHVFEAMDAAGRPRILHTCQGCRILRRGNLHPVEGKLERTFTETPAVRRGLYRTPAHADRQKTA